MVRLSLLLVSIWIVAGSQSCAQSEEVSNKSAGGSAGDASTSGGAAGSSGDAQISNDATGDAPVNPCANLVCNSPPANTCANGNDLTVYAAPGTCDGGNCSYPSSTIPCPNGCSAGVCTGEPCLGVTCNTPPANTCANATTLTVYDPGTCTNGTCSYPSHTEFCTNGCAAGACNGDPCLGVSCTTPPASYCSGANTLTVSDSPGTCSNGICSYTTHDEFCANGCAAGACSGNPCAGVSCTTPPANYCASANGLVSYAATGTCSGGTCSYTSSSSICQFGCTGGACIECTTTANCPSGQWCNGSNCETCNSVAHCGPSCATCSGATPACNGTSCVECTTNADCGSGEVCNSSNTCITGGCTPPTTACSSGGSADGGCSGPYRVNRNTAGSAAGFSSGQYGLCGRSNQFASGGGCAGAGSDAEYRLFMRAGESVAITLTKGFACNGFPFGNLTLKVFEAGCDAACTCAAPTSCSNPVVCAGGNQNTNFTATKDGWYTFVVDSESSTSGDAAWTFTLTLKLTCGALGCGC